MLYSTPGKDVVGRVDTEEHHQTVSFDKEIDDFMKKYNWKRFKT